MSRSVSRSYVTRLFEVGTHLKNVFTLKIWNFYFIFLVDTMLGKYPSFRQWLKTCRNDYASASANALLALEGIPSSSGGPFRLQLWWIAERSSTSVKEGARGTTVLATVSPSWGIGVPLGNRVFTTDLAKAGLQRWGFATGLRSLLRTILYASPQGSSSNSAMSSRHPGSLDLWIAFLRVRRASFQASPRLSSSWVPWCTVE